MSDIVEQLEHHSDKLKELSINLRNEPSGGCQGIAEKRWAEVMMKALNEIVALSAANASLQERIDKLCYERRKLLNRGGSDE